MNRLESARRAAMRRGRLLDLIDTSFHNAGLRAPEALYEAAWRRWRARPAYTPDPAGLSVARAAVADWYSAQGVATRPDQVLLTGGSSISYELIFRYLASGASGAATTSHSATGWPSVAGGADAAGAAGGLGAGSGADAGGARGASGVREVLLPRPGYPLFEELTAAAGLRPRFYTLLPERGFAPDVAAFGHVETRSGAAGAEPTAWVAAPGAARPRAHTTMRPTRQNTARPTALVLISPNNPTAQVLDEVTTRSAVEWSARAGVPIISDEVFSAFLYAGAAHVRAGGFAETAGALTFTLNGLSKLYAAPEIKLGWIVVHGPRARVRAAVNALSILHDTYLSASAFAEWACFTFLSEGPEVPTRIAAALHHRRDRFLKRLALEAPNLQAVAPYGGVHCLLRVHPSAARAVAGTADDEELALALVKRAGVYTHPGYLYGMDEPPFDQDVYLVTSFMQPEDQTAAALEQLSALLRTSHTTHET